MVLGLLRGFVKAAEIFRAGWWAAHLLETFIHAPPYPIPGLIFGTMIHHLHPPGSGPAIQPLSFKCFCLAVVYDVAIPP